MQSVSSWKTKNFLAMLLVLSLSMSAAMAQDDGGDLSTLDEELLDDLGSGLFEDIDLSPDALLPQEEKLPEKQPAGTQDGQPDESTEPEKGASSEPSVASQENPLTKIGSLMREVEKRIAKGEAQDNTLAMQDEIIKEIEKLLNQQSQASKNAQQNNRSQNQQNQDQQQQSKQSQQQQQSGSKQQSGNEQSGQQQQQGQSTSQSQQPGQAPQPAKQMGDQGKEAAQQNDQKDGNEEDTNSSDKLRNDPVVAISPEAQDALIKKVWGNLPTHLRKQISNASSERFLPKYEELTQEYFRRLAEKQD